MNVILLDLNVFVALAWPAHTHHTAAQKWFQGRRRSKWASCPITQLGFVRLLSNPAFSVDALSSAEAVELLGKNVREPNHEFWPDSLQVASALRFPDGQALSFRQITDAYLLALAVRRQGRLATFDRGLVDMAAQAKVAMHVELVLTS